MEKIILPKQRDIEIPGAEIRMNMSLEALRKISQYVLESKKMKAGDTFTITGTDGKKLKLFLQ